MFNAVGGSTIHWSGHFPRFRPSDFRVRTLDGVADDWPLTYWDLAPYYDQNDAFIGVSGLHGDPAYPPRPPRHGPPIGSGRGRRGLRARAWSASAGTGGRRTAPCSPPPGEPTSPMGPLRAGARRLQRLRPLRPGLPHRRHVQRPRHLLAGGARQAGSTCAPRPGCARSRWTARGGPRGAVYYDATGRVQEQRGAPGGAGLQRHRHAPPAAQLRLRALPPGPGQLQRAGGAEPDVPPGGLRQRGLRRASTAYQGPLGTFLHCQEFYETDRQRGFVRGFQLQLYRDCGPLADRPGGLHRAPGWPGGRTTTASVRERYAHTLNVCVMVDDLPGGAQPVTLSPDADRRPRHPGPQGQLHREREQPPGAGLRHRTGGRAARRGRGPHRAPRPAGARDRLAPDGHGAHGRRPGHAPSSTAGAGPTTSPTCSSSTAASSSPARSSTPRPPSRPSPCARADWLREHFQEVAA